METARGVQRKADRLRREHRAAELQVAKAKRQRDLLEEELCEAQSVYYEIQFNGVTCDVEECSTRMLQSEAIEIDNEFFCEAHRLATGLLPVKEGER